MAQEQENSYKLWKALSDDYDMGSYDQFKNDIQDDAKRRKLYDAIVNDYDLPDFDGFTQQLGVTHYSWEGQAVMPVDQADQRVMTDASGRHAGTESGTGAVVQEPQPQQAAPQQTTVQAHPVTVEQQAAPDYSFTYLEETDTPEEGELRMSMKPANWAYSERVNRSSGSHTSSNSPIQRLSMDGSKLDYGVEREALNELKDMSDDEIYKYTNALYNLNWDSLSDEQRRDAASRLAAAGWELHARDIGVGHAGDIKRHTDEVKTNLLYPKYRKLYDQGQWADPVGTMLKQYDQLFAEQATPGGTMGQQQATKIANRVLRAADKDQMFTWALQEAERTDGDPYKIYEDIYDRFHAKVKDKLGAYNTRGQAAGLLGDIDAMIAEKWRAAEEADRSRDYGFLQMFVDAENPGNRVAERLMNDPEMWALEYAQRTIQGVNNLIAEADHNAASGNFAAWLESSFAGGAVRGFGQAVFDVRTWDMGFGDMRDATALMTALNKSDKGQPLTRAEQALLDAKAVELAANAYFKTQVGYGYEAGKVTGESLPFMLEMMINPASKTGSLAVNKLVRYALKRFPQRGARAVERQAVRAVERQAVRTAERRGVYTLGEKMANRVLESAGVIVETAGKKTAAGKAVRAVVKTAGNVAGSAVMAGTTGLPGVIADTENRMIGQLEYDTDETGKVHVTDNVFGVPMITAFRQALVARGVENVTEMSEFDVLSEWLGGLTRKALDKLHMSDVYKFFDDIKMSDVAKVVQDFEERTHWQGTFGEYLEEVEGGILNAWLVGDQTLDTDPETGVFNPDNNVKTFLGVSLLGGAFSTVQTVGYRTPKARMRKDIEDADKRASELWGGTWQQFKSSVDEADDEEMEVLLANIVVNGNYSVDQRRAAAEYIKSVVTYRGAMKGEEIRAVAGDSNPEDEQSYEQGYEAKGEQRADVTGDLKQAEQRLTDMGFDMSTFEGWTSDKFDEAIEGQDHGYSDEELDAIHEYFRAKAAADGIDQRVEDDIEQQVQQSNDLVDRQTNQGTGMVHRAVLNNGQEVYVTGGQLVMTGDGTMIDTEASDESLFVYNPATGQPEQYNPSDFKSVDDPISPEQLKSEAARDIRLSVEQQAENEKNGVLPFNQGDSYEVLFDGVPTAVTVVEDQGDMVAVQRAGMPEPELMPKQVIQQAADDMRQAKRSARTPSKLPSRGAGARETNRPTAEIGGAVERQQAPQVPIDEKTGDPVWEQTTPEEGYAYLQSTGLSDTQITELIDDHLAQAERSAAQAGKGGSVRTIDERLSAGKARNYWQSMKSLHDAAMQQRTQQAIPNVGAAAVPGTSTGAAQGTATQAGAPAGAERVAASQSQTMPVGKVAVNIDGTRANDRGQMGIRPEDEAYFLKHMSQGTMRFLDRVAKSLAWKIRLYNGKDANERGFYANGVVWINRRSFTRRLAQWILGHEMTHGMASRAGRNSTVFKDYKKAACDYHRRQVGDKKYEEEIKQLIEDYIKHLKKNELDTSVVNRAYVEEEIACDVTGDLLLNNPEMLGRMFDGVDIGRKKSIIEMLIDALEWLKSNWPWRSEGRKRFDELISNLNKLYNDARLQTGIGEATRSQGASQVDDEDGTEREGSFSITGNAEGTGFTASETVLEVWRVPQPDGTYKEEERWVKRPLLDRDGNVVFRMGDKEFSGRTPITVEDLKENPDTILNYMLQDALNAGTINETKADQVRQQYADMLNLYLEKGMADENGNGFENLEKKWLWVGETVYRTVASNSDEQYSYSIDITKVCKKNEAVIRAISAMQVKTGYGVTPAQILEIYEATDAEGFQVPCPVCYVFSRYINNGKYATAIVNGMKKYGKYLPGQAEAKPVEWWVKEMKDAQARAKKMETPIKNANDDVKVILQQIDTLCREITSGTLSAEEAESKRRHVRALDQRYRAALDVISQEALPRWIKAFVIEGSDQGGWSLREDAALPEDMDDFTLHALDIRKTASAMEKYPALTRYRRAGGSAGGKEITFASNNELGTIIMGLGISKDKLDDYPNYYQLAADAATAEERQALLQKARERFDKARLYAQRQTLRGGQRMWSWSDNIESLSSDVASNLMQLELLGGALQTYSKQLEGVKMVAAMNGYVNASLMGYGDGIREVGPDEIENGRLKDDIWDVNNKGRRRIIANAGSPVYHNAADGKDYVLVFDDVVGIDPFGHDGKRGLFSLNEEYDRAGNILVGMNDIHVRAAMADPRVFFIIPWHASGMSNHILKQMFNILGVNMDQFVSTDYTKMQEETNYLLKKDDGSPKKKVPKEVEDFWDSHTYEDEFACGTGHIENGNRQGGLSDSQLHYRALRDAIFDGTAKDNEDMMDEILADEFLSQVYRQVTTRVADGKMTEKDKEFIYPYEYWQMTEVDENGNEVPARVENADVNGRRYVEYCRRMGFKPKFTGKYDDKTGYSPEGNFADDPGYWKLLIDRRMYDRRGNYQDLTPVDSSGLDSSMYDPDQTQEEFNVTEVATNEGAEKIADTVYQNDTERSGSMPAPNLDMTMDEAVGRYKDVTALQASLIKAEREALKAAEVAKEKADKAKDLKAQDVDGRKAKTVARAQESARKAMEVAKQKASEVEEIAGKFGDNTERGGENARFSLEDPRFREVVNNGGRLQIIQSRKGTFREVYDYETGERRKVRSSEGGWRIEGMPGEYDSREAAINEWRERSSGDLLWSVSDDGKYIEVEGEGDALERLSGRSNDPAQAERWSQQRAEKGRRITDDMASELGVTVHYVDDMTDEERSALSDRQRRAKGWFDPKTGDVYINLGNHNRLYDIVSTVLHNVVANKGLRGLFGESFPGFLDQVYNNVDKHTRAEIDRIAERNGGDRRDATEEYLALMAERMDLRHPENYQYMNDAVREFAIEEWKDGGLKWGHAIEDDDLRRVLFESYHNMQREGAMGVARSVAFTDQVSRERAAQNAAIPRQGDVAAEDEGVRFSIRTKPAPKKTRKAYKLMRLVDGKLYPLFIGNNEEMKLHTWYDADSPALDMLTSLEPGDHLLNMETGETMTWDEYAEQHVPKDKNGKPKRGKPNVDDIHWANENGLRFMHIEDKAGSRSENDARKKYGDTRLYYNWGINGSKDSENGEGSASLYALRPGLHTGAVCSMPQIGYDNPDGGTMRLDNQVWVEVEMADDVDYQSEAESNASRDIPTHIPVDGNYRYATNPTQKKSKSGDTETDKQKGDWYVTGAMKITKILSDEEADEVVRKYNKKYGTNIPLDYRRRGGRVFNAETMQLEEAGDSLKPFHDMIDELYNNPNFDRIAHSREHYDLGTAPGYMKKLGITGEYFTISFKSIKDHLGKDEDHNLSAKEWHELPEAIKHPFLITSYGGKSNKFRLYTSIKVGNKFAVVGVDVVRVNRGKNIPMLELNRIKTVFGRNRYVMENGERILAWDKNITPEQEALLRGHNLREYPTIQELSAGKGTADSETVQENDVKFSLAPTFYSNAAKAVEGVKQEKAKAEQWKAMLTKAGGIKAGEDKWMGLSTWLDEHKGETLTKDEVREFVADNGIEMEEVNYGGVKFVTQDDGTVTIEGHPEIEMRPVAGIGYYDYYYDGNKVARIVSLEAAKENARNDIVDDEHNRINPTRERYTTPGLENKREIAFVVPGVEPYQEHDEIHFGPENQGRAVMWVRFGETTDAEGNRVLVIDEIQSNRHQDAREKGYEDPALTERLKQIQQEIDAATKEFDDFDDTLRQKYGVSTNYTKIEKTREGWGRNHRLVPNEDVLTKEEVQKWKEGDENIKALRDVKDKLLVDRMWQEGVPAAPFEKNWHEVAMKRMLRLAAEEGFDKVAWTTGEQQADRYDIRNVVEDLYYKKNDDGTYNISVQTKDSRGHGDGRYDDYGVQAFPNQSEADLANLLGKEIAQKIIEGKGRKGYTHNGETGWTTFKGNDLKIGGEGMKGFYDKMLPRFMDKYGKKWCVKTGEVTLDTPGKEVMHSVDVTPEMRRSVMTEGQPLFSLSLGAPYQGSKGQIATRVVDALPSGRRFVDLFAGGGAVTHAAMLSGKYGEYRVNDINPAGLELFLGGMRGDYRDYIPREMSAEEFKAIKGTPEGLMLSYSGFGRNLDPDKESVARRVRRVQRLEQLKPYADQVESSNSDYRDVELEPGDVVYADIPYEGTNKTGYRDGAMFDKAAFSEWGLAQDVPIYVSEQSMPAGWVEVASWEMPSMNAQKKRGEKLFVQERFAGDGGNATAHGTTRGIQGLDGYTEQDVLDGVRGDIETKLEEAGVDDVTIKGMALHGSRMRGDARDDSDLDVVMEYDGDWSEDALFDLLNEEPVYFDGIKVDINPITRGKSGTLEQYMERSRRYDEEKIRAKSAQYNDNAEARFSLSVEDAIREVEQYEAKYGGAKKHIVNTPEDLMKIPGLFDTLEDAQDCYDYLKKRGSAAVCIRETGEIIIFVPNLKQGETERSCFHEDFHSWLISKYGQGQVRVLCEHYLEAAKDKYPITYQSVKDNYEEREHAEEFMAYRMEKSLASGLVDKGIYRYLNDEDRKLLDEFLESIHYDTEKERAERRQKRLGEASLSGGHGGTSEESTRSDGSRSGEGPGGRTEGDSGEVRFSLSGDGTVEEYNKAVNMTGRTVNVLGRERKPGLTRYNFQEAFQDAILAVKKLQQVVERHFGIKLPTRENAWMYENRLSSINMHERKSFIDKVYEPMMKIADAIMKRGVKEKELNAYLICKHGLERNQVFAERDAQEEANEIARNGGTPDMQQLLDKYRQRDYSGLTGVTGIEGDIADIEAEAQRIVDEFEQKHGRLCDELWDAIRKATHWSLRKSYQSGMMSAATFNHVSNMFQYYIPLRGWSETTAEDVYSYMMGEHGAFNGVLKKAEGRTSVADDPLATIGNMAESALMQGNKNLLKQHLLRMAQNHPTDVCHVRDVWLVEGPGGVWEPHWPNIPDDATPDEIDQILQDHEADMQQLEASGQAKRVKNNLDIPYRIDPRHVPEHAVVAKVAGIDHVVYINGNPRAAQAINGMTGRREIKITWLKFLVDHVFGDLKRFYSSVLTSLNINFSGANFVRDLPHAYAMTFIKQGPLKAAEYIAKSFQVIPWVFKNQLGKTGNSRIDRYFQEFLSSGAVTGYAHINDVDAWKADNKRRFARLSALGKAKVAVPRAMGAVIDAIGWFSETLELIPRFTAFMVERQAGKDIATATKAAKDITTNFNKKGSEVTPGVWGAVAGALRYMKMFFNPIVQGMYQFVDVAGQAKENKWVGARMVLATMHLPVLGAIVPYLNQFLLEALGGDDDDDYWLLNEYTRRNNVCIFTGNGYVKIPIAPVFRELYGMGEVVATRHAGKADNEKTTIDLIDQLRTMGSVEGQSSYKEWSAARFLLPEHFSPLIDVMNNENFTGGPIYYENNYREYAPEYTKAKQSTWSPLVAASKWLNEMMGGDEDIAADKSGKWMNPAVWQHLITNVGGGFAQLAGDVVAGVTDIAEGKEIDASNIPVVKRFYSGSSSERAQWARFGIYKDFEKEYTRAKEKYQALDKRGLSPMERADEMVRFAQSHPKAAAVYAVWEGGIKGADIPGRLEKLGKEDQEYWDLVKEAVDKAEKAMNSGYVRAWEQKRKDRPDQMNDKELNERFDNSDNDSIRHIMGKEIAKRAGSQDFRGLEPQDDWSDKSVAAWEAYQNHRTSDDIKADAELSNLLKVDDGEKDKARIKMLGYIKDELNKIRRGKDATSRSAGVKGFGEGDDERVMNELRAARKQLIEDLKNGSAEQAYRNLERRTMRLGLRKKPKEL